MYSLETDEEQLTDFTYKLETDQLLSEEGPGSKMKGWVVR